MSDENYIPDDAADFKKSGAQENPFLEAMQQPVVDEGNEASGGDALAGLEVGPYAELNMSFSRYESVFKPENLKMLREIEDPILVDLDGTVWTQHEDNRELRPGIAEFLDYIRENGGTVVFATSVNSAESYAAKYALLREAGLWDPESSVLITSDSWTEMTTDTLAPEDLAVKDQMFADFEEICDELGWIDPNVGRRDPKSRSNIRKMRGQRSNSKHLAPLFLKRHKIPLIDDDAETGLGMNALRIQSFDASEEQVSALGYDVTNPGFRRTLGGEDVLTFEEVQQELAKHFEERRAAA